MLDLLFEFLMAVCAFMMIVLVLLQRGKGGGLAGAFGGMGGQSAFGTKAGDTFTRVTMVLAAVWILICILAAKFGGASAKGLINVPTVVSRPADSAQGAAPGPATTSKRTGAAVAADSAKMAPGGPVKVRPGESTDSLPEPSSNPMPADTTKPASAPPATSAK